MLEGRAMTNQTSDDPQMDKVFEIYMQRLEGCMSEGMTTVDATKSALKCAIAYNTLSSDSLISLVETMKGWQNG
jgi:hypothetical protein